MPDGAAANNDSEDDIRALVERAQQGDRGAFAALAERFRTRLEVSVKRHLGQSLRRRVTVGDVVQETFLRAWRGIEGMRWIDAKAFLSWLRGIARRVVLESAGRERREMAVPLEVEVAGNEISPSRALQREEGFDALESAFRRLPADYRRAILLVRVEGISVTETARRMGRSPNAVSHLLLRGLRKMRELLADTESLRHPVRRPGAGTDRDGGERDGATGREEGGDTR